MKTTCSWMRQQKKRPKIKQLEKLASDAALAAGLPEGLMISFVFLPDRKMAELNETSLGHHGPTDVICFDLRESEPDFPKTDEDGAADIEIYVCPDVAAREAAKRNLPYADEVVLYMSHGLLHASGEDDLVPAKKRVMRRREKQVMSSLREKYHFERIFSGETAQSVPDAPR